MARLGTKDRFATRSVTLGMNRNGAAQLLCGFTHRTATRHRLPLTLPQPHPSSHR